jgi:DNA-binding NarL/FixJ family response regulator
MRVGLRQLLDRELDIEVVGEAANGDEALRLAVQLLPDVLLADIVMPPPDGVELARRLRSELPSIRTLVLTPFPDARISQMASRAGAAGCIVKQFAFDELAAAIRVVAARGSYLSGQRNGGQG